MRISVKCPNGVLLSALAAIPMLLSAAAGAAEPAYEHYEHREQQQRQDAYDDTQDIPWIENEIEVLAVPREEDLSPVQIDRMPEGLQLFIDKSRITVNPDDRIVRVWLWVRSSGGAENGTFEGYRCATGEYKVYAYANPQRDPPVTKAKRPVWRPVTEQMNRGYRAELLKDYFCGIRGTRDPHEIRNYLTGTFRRETFFSN